MSNRTSQFVFRAILVVAALVFTGLTTGCASFWTPITTTTTTNTGTGFDLVYAGKNNNNSFVGYAITSGGLTVVSGSPFSMGAPPLSMVITPADTFLYVANTIGIYGYAINAGGALSSVSGGSVLDNASVYTNGPLAMAVSPDGQWLAVLTNAASGSATLEIDQITTNTGLLTATAFVTFATTTSTAQGHSIQFSPNEDLLAATYGTDGTYVFTFNGNTGGISQTAANHFSPPASGDSDNDAIFNASGNILYVTRGGAGASMWIYPIITTTGVASGSAAFVATGMNPTAISFNNSTTQPYIYVDNANDSTISGYSVTTSSGNTTVSGFSYSGYTPFTASGAGPYAIAYDNSDTYMLAMNASGPPDLVQYTVDGGTLDPGSATSGRLYVTGSVNTGLGAIISDPSVVSMAVTH